MTRREAEAAPKTAADYVKARTRARIMVVANHPERPNIDHDIPPPVERRGGLRKFDHFYPFEEMKVGDSFWVPSTTHCTCGAVTKFARQSGWKFVTRAQCQDGSPNASVSSRGGLRGTRVWRIG